jgi:hypothetical protein
MIEDRDCGVQYCVSELTSFVLVVRRLGNHRV